VSTHSVAKFRNSATELDPSSVNGLSVAYMSCKIRRSIGYARVSTAGQDLSRQIRALKTERCTTIFTDTASGKSLEARPELAKAIAALMPGDILMLAEWYRATIDVGRVADRQTGARRRRHNPGTRLPFSRPDHARGSWISRAVFSDG
jgi:Resolvase, N terminal domain